MFVQMCVLAYVSTCVRVRRRSCARWCLPECVSACVCACVCPCVRSCVRVRASLRACVCAIERRSTPNGTAYVYVNE